MFEVKWFLFKSEKEMNTDKILPIDLYHAVSTANLTLESTLKIIHVEVGQDHELLPLEPGTLAVICRGGKFECKALGKEISIVAGQVFLASVEDVSDISRFSETGFEGIVIYAGSDLLINRQRLMFRTITPDELEESGLYIRLMQSQIERMSDVRVKVVESLLRALIFFLQQGGHLADDRDSEVPPFFHDFALLIRRYHHYPLSHLHHLEFLRIEGKCYALMFNGNFYCIHGNDHEVSCNGLLFHGSSHVLTFVLSEDERRNIDGARVGK